jgi:hypothetical protein
MTTKSLARRIVALYPRRWRARYGQEMLALVEQSSVRTSDVIDLASGGATEWFRPNSLCRILVALALATGCSAFAALVAAGLRSRGLDTWISPDVTSALWLGTAIAWIVRLYVPPPSRISRLWLVLNSAQAVVLSICWHLSHPTVPIAFGFDTWILFATAARVAHDLVRPVSPLEPLGPGPWGLGPSS